MAINIIGGKANVAFARFDVAVAATGINASNTLKIFQMDEVILSYVPGRLINGFTIFRADKGYIIHALEDMDLTDYLQPPFALEWTERDW